MSNTPSSTEHTAPDGRPEQLNAGVNASEQANDTSGLKPSSGESRPDEPGFATRHENPDQEPGARQVRGLERLLTRETPLTSHPHPGYVTPGTGGPPSHMYQSYQPGVVQQPSRVEADGQGHENDGSASEPNTEVSRPDAPESTDHRENPNQAPGAQHASGNVGVPPQGALFPPTPPQGYAIPGTGAPPYYLYQSNPPWVVQQPLSGVSRPPVPPLAHPPFSPFAQPPLPQFSHPHFPAPLRPANALPGTQPPPQSTSNPEYQLQQAQGFHTPLSGVSRPPLPPTSRPAHTIPGTQPPPLNISNPEHQSQQAQDIQTPLSGVSQPYLPLALPPAYTIPGTGAPPFIPPRPGSQPEFFHTSPYGYSQAQYNPYTPLPNWIGPPPPTLPPPQPLYSSPPLPDLSNTLPQDNSRTIAHRFAGFLFNIRTDAEVASKKLRAKPVDNHVEYYCSGVLLTKIKYKLERDIFSLYEDPDMEPLRDAKLCEKIEILIGPIVAGLFEEPWGPTDFNFAWGVRGCEGIGDGNFFHVDVLRDVDGVSKYDSPSRQLQRSPSARSRPTVADMDAFHRIPSLEATGDLSRSPYDQRSIDRTHLLNVLREIELLTAMELGKRSYLTGSAVASVIGRNDFTLTERHRNIYRTFSTEVPTLFGLFVSNLSRWSKGFSDLALSFRSSSHFKRKHGDEEEPLGSRVLYEEEGYTTPNNENVLSSGSDLDKLPPPFPVAPTLSAVPGNVGAGSEDEENTTLDGQSLTSDDAIAWYDVGLSSVDDEQGSSDRQSQASGDDAIAWYDAGLSSEDDDQGGSDRLSPAPNEDLNSHLDNNNGGLPIGADAIHTERIRTNAIQSVSLSHIELQPPTLGFRPPPPSVPMTITHVPKTNSHHIGSGSSSQPKGSNAEVSGNQKQKWFESQERGTRGERVEGDDDVYSKAEGHTNSQQEKPAKSLEDVSHACAAQEPHKKSQCEYQSEKEKKTEGPSVERENNVRNGWEDSLMWQQRRNESGTSPNEEQIIRRKRGNSQTEEEGMRMQDSSDEESDDRDKVSAHESDDIPREQSSTLRQSHDVKPKPEKKVRFTVSSTEQSVSSGDNAKARLEDERHRDEFNEARRAHLRAAYPSYPLRDNSPAYPYDSSAYPYGSPAYSYLPQNPSPKSPTYSQSVAPSVVEPYQEAVAAGQIYDVPITPDVLPKPEDSLPNTPEDHFNIIGSHDHHPPPTLIPSEVGALPRPATSSKPSGLFSRKSSYKPMHDGDLSSESTFASHDYRKQNRIPLLIGKDTLSVTLGVVIVILSILAVVFDPAGEENWFKRVEEGVFVMFSLGIPLLFAMRARLTHNLEIMMPNLKRKVRSIRDLERLNERTDRADFVKQLQRELVFNEELSTLFSLRDACYKLSRTSGNLVVPERAKYRKVFREVWFFGEEHAYNKILGKAFRYQQKDNVLMIENESVDIEGVIVHVRRRKGKYTFGSSLEK